MNHIIFRRFFYFVVIALLSFRAVAETPNLVALELPGLTDNKQQGAYANVYNALQQEGLIKSWKAAPVRRAHQFFFQKKAACIAPASLDLLKEYGKDVALFAPAQPFNAMKGYLFEAPNRRKNPAELPLLGVVGLGFLHGVDQTKYRLIDLKSYSNLLDLLGKSRLPLAYINYPDVNYFPQSKEIIADFKGTITLKWAGIDGVLCWKEYAEDVAKIGTALNRYRKDQTLRDMLGEYFVGD
ncbi:MAG: hypothetical protein JKY34_09515 [Kordiimonadaceae bacterium]|nr:hypothetical protein [Kordiimonadaceae bacterium]